MDGKAMALNLDRDRDLDPDQKMAEESDGVKLQERVFAAIGVKLFRGIAA